MKSNNAKTETKELKYGWSQELANDLRTVQNISIEDILIDQLEKNIKGPIILKPYKEVENPKSVFDESYN